jgi:hypothetical protein
VKKLPSLIAYGVLFTGLALLLLSVVADVVWAPDKLPEKVIVGFVRDLVDKI